MSSVTSSTTKDKLESSSNTLNNSLMTVNQPKKRISVSAAVALAQKLAASSLSENPPGADIKKPSRKESYGNDENNEGRIKDSYCDNTPESGRLSTSQTCDPSTTGLDMIAHEDSEHNHISKALEKDDFINPSKLEMAKITSMLKQRLYEGQNETILDIGVEENGDSMKLTDSEFQSYLKTLTNAADSLHADLVLLQKRNHLAFGTAGSSTEELVQTLPTDENCFNYGHVLIRKRGGVVEDILELRVAVVGNVDAGKSTLLGVLTKDLLDDGRGRARVNLFRHKHEIESGRTSSVGTEIMGFTSDAKIITPTLIGKPKMGWEDICQTASKVLTFFDLAGHEKYLKTTVFGMTGCVPDYVMLMVGANAGIIGMTKEHLGLALALNVPVFIVVTKIDMCPKNILDATINNLTKILKSTGCRKIPMFINSIDDVIISAGTFVSERVCPIFQVSNVSGQNLNLLKLFLNVLHSKGASKYDTNHPVEYQITDTFSVPGVGTVVCGTLTSGIVHIGDSLLLGPDNVGQFTPTIVKSIQRKRVTVPCASAGQTCTFALKKVKRASIRKGMVMLSKSLNPQSCYEFEAEILVLYHSTTINTKYQTMLHCGGVRQTARIVSMDKAILRTGDRAIVRFRFIQRPEYLKPGTRLLFREGRTKGVGKIVRTIPESEVRNALSDETNQKKH